MRTLTSAARVLLVTLFGVCLATPALAQYAAPPPPDYQGYDVQYSEPPPPLPVYDQPPVPVEGYIWIPGVWSLGPDGYFWVPGTWVAPPAAGLLWTPGFWAIVGAVFVFHMGYWGPHVGYYGGINYGHGYFGDGYAGGRWVNNRFQYNTAVTNINTTVVHNTYNQTIVNNVNVKNVTNVTRTSYVGGPGTRAQPTAAEAAAAREAHQPPTAVQVQHEMAARSQPQLAASRNKGHPPIAATPRPAQFTAAGATKAQPGGPAYRPPSPSAHGSPAAVVHARDLPKVESKAPAAASASASAEQQAAARQQAQTRARQEQERQALAQKQQQEHTNFAKQSAHDHQAYEAMERQHQQQTQQMVQRHQQENAPAPKKEAPRSEHDTPK